MLGRQEPQAFLLTAAHLTRLIHSSQPVARARQQHTLLASAALALTMRSRLARRKRWRLPLTVALLARRARSSPMVSAALVPATRAALPSREWVFPLTAVRSERAHSRRAPLASGALALATKGALRRQESWMFPPSVALVVTHRVHSSLPARAYSRDAYPVYAALLLTLKVKLAQRGSVFARPVVQQAVLVHPLHVPLAHVVLAL